MEEKVTAVAAQDVAGDELLEAALAGEAQAWVHRAGA